MKRTDLFIAKPAILLSLIMIGACWVALSHAEPGITKNEPAIWSEDKRFVDQRDHSIIDTQTGLMWLKSDSYQITGHWMNWTDSFKFISALNETGFANHFDWRLPTLDELRTLYEAKKINSAQVGREMVIHIDPVFAKEGSGSLWSSEVNGHFNAFGIIFNNGQRFSAHKSSKSRKAVRAVRTAHPPAN